MPRSLTYSKDHVRLETIHSAITADVAAAAARKIYCAGAKAIGLMLTMANVVNRTWTATVEVSYDNGVTWAAYAMLISNVANTNAQFTTRSASLATNANGTVVANFDPQTLGAITHFRVPMTKTDGATPAGDATVKAAIQM